MRWFPLDTGTPQTRSAPVESFILAARRALSSKRFTSIPGMSSVGTMISAATKGPIWSFTVHNRSGAFPALEAVIKSSRSASVSLFSTTNLRAGVCAAPNSSARACTNWSAPSASPSWVQILYSLADFPPQAKSAMLTRRAAVTFMIFIESFSLN